MSWKSPHVPWLAAILSGVLLAACYPNWDRAELVWVWQAPLLLVLWFHGRTGGPLIAFRLLPRLPRRLRETRPGRILLLPVRGIDWILGGDGSQPRWQWGLKVGYLAGFTFFVFSLSWLRHVTGPGWILFSAYLAVYFAAWGAFAASIGRLDRARIALPEPSGEPERPAWRGLTAKSSRLDLFEPSFHAIGIAFLNGACWVGLEWIRGWLFTGFGWNGLGVALRDSPHLIQIADVVGVTGLSFLPVYVTCIVTATVARLTLELGRGRLRPHLDFASAMVLLILVFFYGVQSRTNHPIDDPVDLNVLLVQGNVPILDRYDREKAPGILPLYEKLTSLYAGGDHDLVMWPETALPYTFYEQRTLDYLDRVLALGDFHLLAGVEQVSLADESSYDVHNSMLLMRGSVDGYQAYQKIHLVPFGEYIPFRHSFPLFRWVLGRLIPEDFDVGTNLERLRLSEPAIELIPTICFEDTIGRLTRRFVRDQPTGPQLIVNLTNDAWFERSQANAQHLANARFRCVELKRPLVRCANTGISGAIDPFGSLVDPQFPGEQRVFRDPTTGSPFLTGCFPVRLKIDSKPSTTVYAVHGDWFSRLMSGIALAAVGLTVYLRRRSSRSTGRVT